MKLNSNLKFPYPFKCGFLTCIRDPRWVISVSDDYQMLYTFSTKIHWLSVILNYVNWLQPSDDINLCQYCLRYWLVVTAPSHYLNLFWPFTNRVIWHSTEINSTARAKDINSINGFQNSYFTVTTIYLGGQWVIWSNNAMQNGRSCEISPHVESHRHLSKMATQNDYTTHKCISLSVDYQPDKYR